ncbi:hypothetical protein JZ751_026125 [Albula glossodonta]|uniref:Uncharacterized protein n=1 Tax=Albula glossodonta TaxID=121402 RepID=A0A8T2PJE7_9TELE|nr:hypothetical protein JZ751_026125 [Albula glossodonta]
MHTGTDDRCHQKLLPEVPPPQPDLRVRLTLRFPWTNPASPPSSAPALVSAQSFPALGGPSHPHPTEGLSHETTPPPRTSCVTKTRRQATNCFSPHAFI